MWVWLLQGRGGGGGGRMAFELFKGMSNYWVRVRAETCTKVTVIAKRKG